MKIYKENYEYVSLEDGEIQYGDYNLDEVDYVEAEYVQSVNPAYQHNPFIEAIPLPLVTQAEVISRYNCPIASYNAVQIRQMPYAERICQLPMLRDLRFPLAYQLQLEGEAYRAICESYRHRYILANDRATNTETSYTARVCVEDSAPSVKGFALIGRAGSGKTSSVGQYLKHIPQVIRHTGHFGEIKQIPYIFVNCLPNSNIKGLYANIGAAVDKALNLDNRPYETMIIKSGAMEKKQSIVRHLIEEFAIGLIVLDEIQHLAFSGVQEKSFENLLALNNMTKVAFAVIGNEEAYEKIFQTERMARRIGVVIRANTYCENREIFRFNMRGIFNYQWFDEAVPLTVEMEEKLFKYTRGIIDHMISIYTYMNFEYLQGKIKGKDFPVNCQLLDNVVKKYFDGLMNVLKRRDSKKKETEVEIIFKKSREVLSQVFGEESKEKTNQFLQAMASQEKVDATKLEIAIIRNIRKCLPQFTEDVIRSAFKKVYSVKKNQGKGEEELTSLVTSKLLSGPKPKKAKKLDPNEITADLCSVGM